MNKDRIILVMILLTVAAFAVAAPDYYATKADERAGKLTAGQPPGVPPRHYAEGDMCGSPTAIVSTPYSDIGNTTGLTNDKGSLPAGCSSYTTVAGPDVIYVFTVTASNSVAFTVTPNTATYDPAIYVLGTCGTSATCIIGRDVGIANQAESIPAQAYPAGTHAVYIDSFYAEGATCTGQGSILCGNGAYTFQAFGVLPVELMNIRVE